MLHFKNYILNFYIFMQKITEIKVIKYCMVTCPVLVTNNTKILYGITWIKPFVTYMTNNLEYHSKL